MVYRGVVTNGVVVLEGTAVIPEGTTVEVEPVGPAPSLADRDALWRLPDLAMPSGVPDLAENIDHYLYGHPKVSDDE